MRTVAQLREALEKRIVQRREILRLRREENLSLRQIADRIGLSHEMVRQILRQDPGWEDDGRG